MAARSDLIQRLALALVALLLLAWLAVDYRDSRLIRRAESVAVGPFPSRPHLPAYFRSVGRAVHDARDARALNPDSSEPVQVQAALDVKRGRPGSAIALLKRLVRDEPRDIRAWAMLAQIAEGPDPALSRRAIRRVAELDPEYARRVR